MVKTVHEDYAESFPPIVGNSPRVLILGTMPGKESLRKQEYYGHRSNAFWKIMLKLFSEHNLEIYAEKATLLKSVDIAVWDICHSAIRKGSLDSNIKAEQPNKLDLFLANFPSIEKIGFNGQKAEKLYCKYFNRREYIYYQTLLSTSPANATYSFEQKYLNWSNFLKA